MDEHDFTYFGRRLAGMMEDAGIESQSEFARRIDRSPYAGWGLHQQKLSDIMRGTADVQRLHVTILADVLGLDEEKEADLALTMAIGQAHISKHQLGDRYARALAMKKELDERRENRNSGS